MNIVIVGVGGTGISTLAYIFKDLGIENIICIDSNESQITKDLENNGINIIIGHGNYKIQKEDVVIYSDAAINSKEVQQSKNMEFDFKKYHKNFSYFEFLGEISKYFKTISIAGTHGKSTTTAMTSYLANKNCENFGIGILGANVPDFGNKNYIINKNSKNFLFEVIKHILFRKEAKINPNEIKKRYFIIEADEFNKHFLYLDTSIAAITNIELDHSDVYKDFDEYIFTFNEFVNGVDDIFFMLGNKDESRKILNKHKLKLIENKNIDLDNLIGDHNIENGNIAITINKYISGKDEELLRQELKKFKGLWRRGELIYENENGAKVFSDYGHHPTELKTTIDGFKKKFNNKTLNIIFQPHQIRRVIEFWDEFLKILKKENTTIFKIYTAREDIKSIINNGSNIKNIENISDDIELGKYFSKEIGANYINNKDDIIKMINEGKSNEIFLIISAGNLDYEIRKNITKGCEPIKVESK